MTTPGNFAKSFVNGVDLTQDSTQISYQHAFADNRTMAQNTGIEQHAPGVFMPSLNHNGYKRVTRTGLSAHDLYSPSGIGATNDIEFISSHLLGNNAAPAIGDGAIMNVGTLLDFKGPRRYTAQQEFSSQFRSRGIRMPLGILIQDSAVIGSVTSAFYDDGVESVNTVLGAAAILQVHTPTGVQASGTVTFSGQPADGDTVTVNGTAYRFKTAIAAANDILIGATLTATLQNFFAGMTGGDGSGTLYHASTTAVPSTILVSLPVFSTGVITFTAALTGTAGNAYTLAESGANTAVSGATFAGGVAGDTAVIKIQHCDTSGGSYADLMTFTLNGQVRGAEYQSVAIGTTIQRFLKVVATVTGSTHILGFNVCFGRWYVL